MSEMSSPSEMDPAGMLEAAKILSRPADEFGNDETLEYMWAQNTFLHAEIYFNILCSCNPRLLRLTPIDDLIYRTFRHDFPSLNVAFIDEEKMKNSMGKEKWRIFCEKFKGKVEDHSFGTLLRIDTEGEYVEANTTIVARVQFYAIEIARNKEGYNDCLRKRYRPPPADAT